MAKKNLLEANVDDFDIDAIDKKFEQLSAEGAKAMAMNYGSMDAKQEEGDKE